MTDEIKKAAEGAGLRKLIDTKVESYLRVHGEGACLRAIELARRSRRKVSKTGRIPTPSQSWNIATDLVTSQIDSANAMNRKHHEREAALKEREASERRGYVPDRKTIKKQLDVLYADGDISQKDYDHGLIGLQYVHEMVRDGQEAENRAEEVNRSGKAESIGGRREPVTA